MTKTIFILLLGIILISNCSDMQDVKYGNLIFETEYDGLTHTDKLWLYDNGIFKIDMFDLAANGKYKISGDTIFLYYFKYKGKSYQAFLIEGNIIDEIERSGMTWLKRDRNTYMSIIKQDN
jgi:hypothetical protein